MHSPWCDLLGGKVDVFQMLDPTDNGGISQQASATGMSCRKLFIGLSLYAGIFLAFSTKRIAVSPDFFKKKEVADTANVFL